MEDAGLVIAAGALAKGEAQVGCNKCAQEGTHPPQKQTKEHLKLGCPKDPELPKVARRKRLTFWGHDLKWTKQGGNQMVKRLPWASEKRNPKERAVLPIAFLALLEMQSFISMRHR